MNITEHINYFIQEMKRRNYAQNTIDVYVPCLKQFFAWAKADHPKNISAEIIRTYLAGFNQPNTQRANHSAIKKFYSICLHQENKFRYLPYARKQKKLPIILSQDEVQAIFNACVNLKHKTIMALMYATGMRVGEVINLKPQHIDSSRMVINIIQGKGAKDRQVMLPEPLLQLLRQYFRQYRPVEFLFNGQDSTQYSERSINQFLKHYAGQAGIKKRVYAHLFRHSCFTHMVEGGIDINLIQKLAGHSNIKTTMIYCHISDKLISGINSPFSQIQL